MRAFVACAEELHFGRAAARLFLTEQALSKRIRRLEETLATRLFERTTRRVELTPAGQRLLPSANEAIAAFDAAVDVARDPGVGLRVDVHDERFAPMRLVRGLAEHHPGLRIEVSMRQGTAACLPALHGQELDAAFGRVHDLQRPWPSGLAHRLAHLEPVHVYVPDDHPFAARPALRPTDLRTAGIVLADPGGADESRGYMTRFAQHFGIPIRFSAPAVGIRHYEEKTRAEKHAVALGEAGIVLSEDAGLRRIPLVDPTPLHPWHIIWHRRSHNPRLTRLLELLDPPVPPTPDDAGRWIPDVDRLPVPEQPA